MVHDDPTETNPYVIVRLDQLRRFLASRGVPETAYRLAPASRSITGDADAHAIIQAEYGGERFRSGSPGAIIRWPTPSGTAEVRTTESQAQFLIAFAFDRPENLTLLTGLDATIDAPAAAAALGGRPGRAETRCRPVHARRICRTGWQGLGPFSGGAIWRSHMAKS